jgi:hypothetical protein
MAEQPAEMTITGTASDPTGACYQFTGDVCAGLPHGKGVLTSVATGYPEWRVKFANRFFERKCQN